MFAVFVDSACTVNIYTHEFNIACIQAAAKIKSAKTFLTVIPQKFIPSK